MSDILIVGLVFAFQIAAIPIAILLSGKTGAYFALFSAIVGLSETIDLAVSGSITNGLITNCTSLCASESAYPFVLIPLILTIGTFIITITKRF